MENNIETKTRILENAREIIEAEGLKGLTVQRLIEKSNIGKTTFYRIFPTKKDLLLQLKYHSKNTIRIAGIKEQIAEIAREGFSKYGFNGFDMDSIARAAKLNRVTLYRYFSNKEELLEYCIQGEFNKVREIMTANIKNAPGPEEALKQHFAFLGMFHKNSPTNSLISDIWSQSIRNPKIRALSMDLCFFFTSMFVEIIETGKRTGVFREDIDPAIYSRLILMLQNGLMFTIAFEPEIGAVEIIAGIILKMVLKELNPDRSATSAK